MLIKSAKDLDVYRKAYALSMEIFRVRSERIFDENAIVCYPSVIYRISCSMEPDDVV